MNDLIKVDLNEDQEPIISGRVLHEFLEVKTAYKDWFPRMCEYGFVENLDFSSILSESTGGRPSTDHILKLDMAKELSMLQRNEKGKQARQYFIQIEKEFNSPEKIMARALIMADNKVKNLSVENKELKETVEINKPKVLFADSVSSSSTTILVSELQMLSLKITLHK